MAFTKTKLFSFILVPLNLILIYAVFNSVNGKIALAESIKSSEAAVIKKLILIRDLQKAFLDNNQAYCTSWDSLIDFTKNGLVYNVQVIEKVIARDRDDPNYYKGDIIEISYDTLDARPVIEVLVDTLKFPNFNPDRLPYIPGKGDKQFILKVETIQQGNIKAPVIEVIDPYPVDETRKDSNDNRKRKFLRFGSLVTISTTGNWE